MSKNKVSGIGIYEKGVYSAYIDGKRSREYRAWSKMLERCDPNGYTQRLKPAYVGCEVHPDFIKFQDFAEWCYKQIGFSNEGFQLDKDIIHPGNRVYGPDVCAFVPQSINCLLLMNPKSRGDHPLGVSLYKNRYRAEISIDGRSTKLGNRDTPEEAHELYKVAKLNEIRRQAELWKDSIDPRVYAAMIGYRL